MFPGNSVSASCEGANGTPFSAAVTTIVKLGSAESLEDLGEEKWLREDALAARVDSVQF